MKVGKGYYFQKLINSDKGNGQNTNLDFIIYKHKKESKPSTSPSINNATIDLISYV